jgi:hypothetical protein
MFSKGICTFKKESCKRNETIYSLSPTRVKEMLA